VDHIRDLGWPGVVGNTDEMLLRPKALLDLANQSPNLKHLFAALEEMAAASRDALGEERLLLAYIRKLAGMIVANTGSVSLSVTAIPVVPTFCWTMPSRKSARENAR
jgi:hypothetical protein